MQQDSLETVYLRNHFYRDNYRRLMLALLFGFFTLLMLSGALMYLVVYPTSPRYFVVSEEGKLIPAIPMDQPNLSDAALLQWATQAVSRAFSYNYVNYREALQNLRNDFTKEGWDQFTIALNDSNNLSALIQKKLIVSAVPTGAPIIVEQGTRQGIYAWNIQIPLLVTYQSPSEMIPQSLQVELCIVRVPTTESVQGIAIQQFVQVSSANGRGW